MVIKDIYSFAAEKLPIWSANTWAVLQGGTSIATKGVEISKDTARSIVDLTGAASKPIDFLSAVSCLALPAASHAKQEYGVEWAGIGVVVTVFFIWQAMKTCSEATGSCVKDCRPRKALWLAGLAAAMAWGVAMNTQTVYSILRPQLDADIKRCFPS